jgi:hypothetical protein
MSNHPTQTYKLTQTYTILQQPNNLLKVTNIPAICLINNRLTPIIWAHYQNIFKQTRSNQPIPRKQ